MTSDKTTTAGDLTINVTHREGSAVVELNGRVSIDSSPALRDRFLAMLKAEHAEPVTVDLNEVSYIDCSGIATLIEALKIARNRNTTLQLEGLHGRLLHLLEVTGMLSLFGTKVEEVAATEPRTL